jgi:hypothetical protein
MDTTKQQRLDLVIRRYSSQTLIVWFLMCLVLITLHEVRFFGIFRVTFNFKGTIQHNT